MKTNYFRGTAQIVSILFHPLIIMTYIVILLIIINPYSFGVSQISADKSIIIIFSVFATTFILPSVAIALMRQLELIDTSNPQMSRTLPFIITGIFYNFQCYNFYHLPSIPLLLKSAFVGVVLALFIAFIINIFSEISLHAVGMGALLGLILLSILFFKHDTFQIKNTIINMYLLFFLVILLAGIIGSARLLLKNYSLNNLYGGYLVGFSTQIIAFQLFF